MILGKSFNFTTGVGFWVNVKLFLNGDISTPFFIYKNFTLDGCEFQYKKWVNAKRNL